MKHIIARDTREFEMSVYAIIAWYCPLGWPKKHSTASLFSGILDGSSRSSDTGIGDWGRTWTAIGVIIITGITINRCGCHINFQLATGYMQNLWELDEVWCISDGPRSLPPHPPEGVSQTSHKLEPLNHFSPKQRELNSGVSQYYSGNKHTYPLAIAIPNIAIKFPYY